jgi:putative endonuclease
LSGASVRSGETRHHDGIDKAAAETPVDKQSYVYILCSEAYGALCIGVTSDLVKRVWQHRDGLADGFTKTYRIKRLVWFEVHGDIMVAIAREKQLKKWKRAWKIDLIQAANPDWRDLYEDFTV